MKNELKEIPYGYCHCGCGEKTELWKNFGRNKNKPKKFIKDHKIKKKREGFCINGHETNSENIFYDKNGKIKCKICIKNNGIIFRRKNGIPERQATKFDEIKCEHCCKIFKRLHRERKHFKNNFCSLSCKSRHISGYKVINNIEYCKNNHICINGKCEECLKIKKRRKANNQKYKNLQRSRKYRENITDSYIADNLKLSVNDLPDYAIILAREMIKSKRELRELK